MIVLFWAITLFLSLIAIMILILWLKPWLKTNQKSLLALMIIPIFSYAFYYNFGYSQYLTEYYSSNEQKNREQMLRIRPLVAELKKQEYRLRFHLEENPKDFLAQSQLLELLSIQALQTGDQTLAKQFLLKALEVLPPDSPNNVQRKAHIKELLKNNF